MMHIDVTRITKTERVKLAEFYDAYNLSMYLNSLVGGYYDENNEDADTIVLDIFPSDKGVD